MTLRQVLRGGGLATWGELFAARPLGARLALSVAVFLAALALRFAIMPVESGLAYLTFYPGCVLVFLLCGNGPGTVYVALSALVGVYIFTPPYWEMHLSYRALMPVAFFAFSSSLIGAVVSQTKRTREAIRRLHEETPAMLHSCDEQGRIVSVSDLWLAKLGYEREEVLGHPWTDFLAPVAGACPPALVSGQVYQLAQRSGARIDIQVASVAERNHRGEPSGSIVVLQDVTERQAQTQAVDDLSFMLKLVLNNVPARISYWDTNYQNRFANKAFAEWFGCEEDEVVGRQLREIVGEAWTARIMPSVQRGLSGQVTQMETTAQDHTGKLRELEIHFVPDLRGEHVNGLFVFVLDVSAQRSAERELAEREKVFRTLIEGVRDYAIYMLDARGHVQTWSSNASQNTGYQADNVLGRHFRMFFTPEDVAAGLAEVELAVAEQQGVYESEGWRMRANGQRFWAGVMLTALRDEHGQLTGFAKVTRDLTERTRQLDLLARVTEVAPFAMLMVNAEGLITMVNAQMEALFGYAREELVNQPVEVLVPLGLRQAHPGMRTGFLRGPQQARRMASGQKIRAVRRDGSEFSVDIGLSQMETATGPCVLAAVVDITERERQQAAIEQALSDKEILLKEVYHRVKNNLQVVQSLMRLQSGSLPEGAAKEACDENIQRVRAMAMVHEKLYQSGNLSEVSLREYTADLLAQITEAGRTQEREVDVQVDVDPITTGLDGAVPYGLLLTELLANALKHAFTGRSRGCISVCLKATDQGALLSVADDGGGLAPDFSLSAQTSSLGLQLASGLARQLGGELQAHSDNGARFSAVLPRL